VVQDSNTAKTLEGSLSDQSMLMVNRWIVNFFDGLRVFEGTYSMKSRTDMSPSDTKRFIRS
jgi:hypothetical protein